MAFETLKSPTKRKISEALTLLLEPGESEIVSLPVQVIPEHFLPIAVVGGLPAAAIMAKDYFISITNRRFLLIHRSFRGHGDGLALGCPLPEVYARRFKKWLIPSIWLDVPDGRVIRAGFARPWMAEALLLHSKLPSK
jgi:hypothetical protein